MAATGRLTRWNSGTDGESPDGRQHAGRSTPSEARCSRRHLEHPHAGFPAQPRSTPEQGSTGWRREREAAAMRRAVALSASVGEATHPNPNVGAVVLDRAGEVVGEGRHERAGGPHAEVAALAQAGDRAARRHRGRHPRAVRAHRPHRAVRRGAAGGRHRPGRVRGRRPEPGRGRRGRAAARRRGRRRGRAARGRGRAGQRALAHRRTARAPVRGLEGRLDPGRPGRRRRRHQPLDLLARVAGRRAPAARRVRRHRGRRRDGARRRPGADRPRRVRRAGGRAAAAGGRRHRGPYAGRRAGAGRLGAELGRDRGRARDRAPTAGSTWARCCKALHARGRGLVLLEGGPTLAGAFVRAGLVDRVVAYLAPVLLGAGVASLAGTGIEHAGRRRTARGHRRDALRPGRPGRRPARCAPTAGEG